jgi:hypothetical protein
VVEDLSPQDDTRILQLPTVHDQEFCGMIERHPLVSGWRERMEQLASVKRFCAAQPPRKPIEHARRWVKTHRPGVLT